MKGIAFRQPGSLESIPRLKIENFFFLRGLR